MNLESSNTNLAMEVDEILNLLLADNDADEDDDEIGDDFTSALFLRPGI